MFTSNNKKPLPSVRGNVVTFTLISQPTANGAVVEEITGSVQPVVHNPDGTGVENAGPAIPLAASPDPAIQALLAGVKAHLQSYVNTKGL